MSIENEQVVEVSRQVRRAKKRKALKRRASYALYRCFEDGCGWNVVLGRSGGNWMRPGHNRHDKYYVCPVCNHSLQKPRFIVARRGL